MAPPATVPPVSQPPRSDDASASANGAGTNAAYLAGLGLMSSGNSAAPTTGPQPVPLTSDGGPLGTAPSTARALDLTPVGHGDFGAPVHRA
jgi:hypothetical protein